MTESRYTKRADRRALVDAGKRYHAAKLAWMYESFSMIEHGPRLDEYAEAKAELVRLSECYVMGPRKACVLYGQRHYARTKKAKA